jgi:protoporphyrin/coproporphyrin ferrochelatase
MSGGVPEFLEKRQAHGQVSAIGIRGRYAVRAMTPEPTMGVLLVAHGTVTDLDEIDEFLTAIRRGRPPTVELAREIRRRYEAIGGSPLLATTNEQARLLSARLNRPVLVGMRFGSPSLEQALDRATHLGLRRLVVLPMAPYSVGLYFDEARARHRAVAAVTNDHGLELLPASAWGSHPRLVQAHVEMIRRFAGEAIAEGAKVVLSAHSLPTRVIEGGDQYANEIAHAANAIGAALGVPVELGFQSQGADGGRWLGPDLKSIVRALAAGGTTKVVVAPFGFLCDHVETLFDLDIELRAYAEALGVDLCRVPALGVQTSLIDTLVDVFQGALANRARVETPKEVGPC